MRFIKISLLVVLCVVSLIAALFIWFTLPRSHPITLSFLGYAPGSNGLPVGSFRVSNHSAQPIIYLADGPSAPHYSLARVLFHDPTTGMMAATNYNMWFSLYATQLTLPPGGTVTFPVPMIAGVTDVAVGFHYLPQHGPLREAAKEIEIWLTRWACFDKTDREVGTFG